MTTTAIHCQRVTKRFYRYTHRTKSLRELFIRTVLRRPIAERTAEFSLVGLDLDVAHGESVALIGRNGSGKSTMLRLIAGIYSPSEGLIETRGDIAAVIELGAGFNLELTGAENVALYGVIMGLSRGQITERFEEILAFAEIGAFVNEPVKYYSSGMQARLAFAVAICARPEILLIDEALAVGDEEFRVRCLKKLHEFLDRGGTMVVVTHDLDMALSLCSRAIWLDGGRVRLDGPASDVIEDYRDDTSPTSPSIASSDSPSDMQRLC